MQAIFAEATHKLNRRQVRRQWPHPAPAHFSLYRWLERAFALGLLCRDGSGKRGHPFRYWFKEREAVWLKDPLAVFQMPELFVPPAQPEC